MVEHEAMREFMIRERGEDYIECDNCGTKLVPGLVEHWTAQDEPICDGCYWSARIKHEREYDYD